MHTFQILKIEKNYTKILLVAISELQVKYSFSVFSKFPTTNILLFLCRLKKSSLDEMNFENKRQLKNDLSRTFKYKRTGWLNS